MTSVLIDTSYLCKVGFNHPDLRKLFHYSTTGALKVFVPHVAWEERRTQLLEEACGKVDALSRALEALKAECARNIVAGGLMPPALPSWSKAELDAHSNDVMTAFAAENKIEIVALAPDHGERTWGRYFRRELPFNSAEARQNRRKDIPDCWIFEAAIDLKARFPELFALCADGKLATALESIGLVVLSDAEQLLIKIEGLPSEPGPRASPEKDAIRKSWEAPPQNRLEGVLAQAREEFKELDIKILGFVAYIGSPSKDQLFDLLSRSGVSIEIAKNASERLAIAGMITDTGNHFLATNKEAADLAAMSVESEIIKLLES